MFSFKLYKLGLKFFIITILILFAFIILNQYLIAFLVFLVFLFELYFFRDPNREISEAKIISPADGKIIDISKKKHSIKLSIFMRPFDVHVIRSPIRGKVTKTIHEPGKNFPAFTKKSDRNEKMRTIISSHNIEVEVIQIAGAVARRIFSFIKESENVEIGEKIGFISFGSRVDLVLKDVKMDELLVEEGEKIKSGITKIIE